MMPTTQPTTPITIPLGVFYVPGTGYKIGIQVSFAGDGADNFKYYEFDTGAAGVFAGYNKKWWPADVNPVPQPPATEVSTNQYVTIHYSSGKQYTAEVFSVPVSFTQDGKTALLTVQADVGCIVETNVPDWKKDLDATPPVAPLYDYFYGDFGTSIGPGNGSLMAILPQLPAPLCDGFIIDLGPLPSNDTPQPGLVATGSLTIGLTQADMDACTMVAGMAIQTPRDTFPGSGLQTYAERLGAGTMMIGGGATLNGPYPTTFCFDTGAPTTEIHYGTTSLTKADLTPVLTDLDDKNQMVQPGLPFTLEALGAGGDSGWTMTFKTGDVSSKNAVHASAVTAATMPAGYVNTGLEPFFRNKVIYNVAKGVIGFIPYPPSSEA